MSPELEIQLIAALVAIACALPGCFLVLRRMSMMSDAITHTLLLGIVLAFLATHSLTSPLLILGAASVGLLTVCLAETLQRSRRVSEDSAIGLTFPLLFSIAIILITHYADSVHLDADAVLLGELAVVTLAALAGGTLLGYGAFFLFAEAFSMELYQIPTDFTPASAGTGGVVVLGSAVVSGWLVKRIMDRADLVSVIKTRE